MKPIKITTPRLSMSVLSRLCQPGPYSNGGCDLQTLSAKLCAVGKMRKGHLNTFIAKSFFVFVFCFLACHFSSRTFSGVNLLAKFVKKTMKWRSRQVNVLSANWDSHPPSPAYKSPSDAPEVKSMQCGVNTAKKLYSWTKLVKKSSLPLVK